MAHDQDLTTERNARKIDAYYDGLKAVRDGMKRAAPNDLTAALQEAWLVGWDHGLKEPHRPMEGSWVIRHWRDSPDMDLRGQFTAAELRLGHTSRIVRDVLLSRSAGRFVRTSGNVRLELRVFVRPAPTVYVPPVGGGSHPI